MKKIKKYFSIFKISIQNNFAYFSNFLLGTAFFIFILFVMTQLWKAIYLNKGLIEGFSLEMVVWYLIITETIVLSRSNFHTEINETIKSGELAYLLIRPYSFIGYHLFNSLGEIIPKLFAHITVGLLIGVLFTGEIGIDINFPLVFIAILMGITLNFFLYMSIALTAFWTEDNTAFFFIYSKIIFFIGGMMIPVDFLPDWLEKISKALPFVFVTYWPARLAVNFNWDIYKSILGLQLIYVFVTFLLTTIIFKLGVKKVNVNGG